MVSSSVGLQPAEPCELFKPPLSQQHPVQGSVFQRAGCPPAPVRRLSSLLCTETPAQDSGFLLSKTRQAAGALLKSFTQAAPLHCLAVPSEDVLITTTADIYAYPVCITRGCAVLLLEVPPQVLSSSVTFVPGNHKPAPEYTAAALTGCHSSEVPRQHCVPSKHLTGGFLLETSPCSAGLLTCSLSPLPLYSSPSPHPVFFLFARPFSLEKAQFPFGGD